MKAQCPACRGRMSAVGDTLCKDCWKNVPAETRRAYMKVWRRKLAGRATAEQLIRAADACLASARGIFPRRMLGKTLTCSRCSVDMPLRGRFRGGKKDPYCLGCETPAERTEREKKRQWWRAHRGRRAEAAA